MLKVLAGSALGLGLGGGFYACRVEPYWLKVERREIPLGPRHRAAGPIRIVQLSDLHRSRIVPDSYLRKCVARANELDPDLVLMTGDYVTHGLQWTSGLGKVLSGLRAGSGKFASFGNHDGGGWAATCGGPRDTTAIERELAAAGFRALVNQSVTLDVRGVRLAIVGLGDLMAGQFEPHTAFKHVPEGRFVIALSHNPDTLRELENFPADLILCGHTHGGQVCIPFLGPPLLPVEDTRYSAGMYRLGAARAYVNRGLGLLRQVRFNCRPEITCIDLT